MCATCHTILQLKKRVHGVSYATENSSVMGSACFLDPLRSTKNARVLHITQFCNLRMDVWYQLGYHFTHFNHIFLILTLSRVRLVQFFVVIFATDYLIHGNKQCFSIPVFPLPEMLGCPNPLRGTDGKKSDMTALWLGWPNGCATWSVIPSIWCWILLLNSG